MSRTFRSWDVEQRWLLPLSLQELVPASHVAHFGRENLVAANASRHRAQPLSIAKADRRMFGQIKQARAFRQFLLRGLEKVRGEWAMVCTAHNPLKLAEAIG
jgi:hypothetical protein